MRAPAVGMTEALRIAHAYERLEATARGRWDLANRGNRLILEERRAATRELFDRAGLLPLGERNVLEVGCGGGGELAWLVSLGGQPSRLRGVDLLPERISAARQAHPGLGFGVANAESLDFSTWAFDVVMAVTVFSSILDPSAARNVADEIHRVLRPGGALFWYDFRYPSPANRDVRGIGRREVRRLFPGFEGELRSITVMPPLARRLGPVTDAAYPLLARMPPMRSHLIGILKRI